MIVFCYFWDFFLLSSFIIFLILAFSTITIELDEFNINDVKKIIAIGTMIEHREIENTIDYMEFNIKISLWLFGFLPINIKKLNNKKIKKILRKIILKNKKEKQKNEIKYVVKQNKIKKFILAIFKEIYNKIKIKNIKLNMNISLSNAVVTSMCTSMLNIVSGIISSYLFFNEKNEKLKEIEYYNIQINPIFSNELEFSINLEFKISLKTISIIREMFVNKSLLFVNNTSK